MVLEISKFEIAPIIKKGKKKNAEKKRTTNKLRNCWAACVCVLFEHVFIFVGE